MKARFSRTDLVTLALIGGTTLLTASLYGRLPVRIPIHFDIHGTPDGWMNKNLGAWLLTGTALGFWLFLRVGARLLPPRWAERMATSPIDLVAALMTFLLCSLQIMTLHAALTEAPSVGMMLGVLIGAFWLVLGLVLPRVRRNPWIGVRTPWTMTSDENWARTHRVAGYAFTAAGAFGLIGTALTRSCVIALVAMLASGFVPMLYSFVLARRLPPGI